MNNRPSTDGELLQNLMKTLDDSDGSSHSLFADPLAAPTNDLTFAMSAERNLSPVEKVHDTTVLESSMDDRLLKEGLELSEKDKDPEHRSELPSMDLFLIREKNAGELVGQEMENADTITKNVTLTDAEESKVEKAMLRVAQKQATGSIFTIKIDLVAAGGMIGIGVKNLKHNTLTVSMTKRRILPSEETGSVLFPGEAAGLRLGDVIFGVDFVPVRDGAKALVNKIKNKKEKRPRSSSIASNTSNRSRPSIPETPDNDRLSHGSILNSDAEFTNNNIRNNDDTRYMHIQCWRCHQLCADSIQGAQFPRMDEVIVQGYALYRNKVFSNWERWNFISILLSFMVSDLRDRVNVIQQMNFSEITSKSPLSQSTFERKVGPPLSSNKTEQAKQLGAVDLERNILRAKALRAALCVRVVHTKHQPSTDTVVYVLRVEDVQTGLQWVVHRRYNDFFALNEELFDLSPYTRSLNFPKKSFSQTGKNVKLVESRMVTLEQYIRKVLYSLNLHATMDPVASRALRHVQSFLGVDKYIDCIHPPPVDDQRHMETLAFRLLNDFNSPACQQCERFISQINLEGMVGSGPEGYRPVLKHVSQALSEVELFIINQNQKQMVDDLRTRRPEMNEEALNTFVRRCVRRQVESALFLPLRRTIFRILFTFIGSEAAELQSALNTLAKASPEFFMVDGFASKSKGLKRVIHIFGEIVQAYLPADQGQLLMHAADAVMKLHTECVKRRNRHIKKQREATLRNAQADGETNGKEEDEEKEEEEEAMGDFAETEDEGGKSNEEEMKEGTWERTHGVHMFSPEAVNARSLQSAESELCEDDMEDLTIDNIAFQRIGKDSRPPKERWSIGGTVSGKSLLNTNKSAANTVEHDNIAQSTKCISSNGKVAVGGRNRTSTETSLNSTTSTLDYNSDDSDIEGNGFLKLDSQIKFNLPAVIADPVREIFESKETVPAPILYRDESTRLKMGDLSFLGYEDDISGNSAFKVSSTKVEDEGCDDVFGKGLSFPFTESKSRSRSSNDLSNTMNGNSKGKVSATTFNQMKSNGNKPPKRNMSYDGSKRVSEQFSPSIDETRRLSIENTQAAFGSKSTNIRRSASNGPDKSLEKVKESNERKKSSKFTPLDIDISQDLMDLTAKKKSKEKNSLSFRFASFNPLSGKSGKSDSDSEEIDEEDGSVDAGDEEERADASFSETSQNGEEAKNTSGFFEGESLISAVSADDFLPMFTFALARCMLPQLLIIKELMTSLVAMEESYGECGYYIATLEAALIHLKELANDYANNKAEGKETT